MAGILRRIGPFKRLNGRKRSGWLFKSAPAMPRSGLKWGWHYRRICAGGDKFDCGNLLISVRMRAPLAPYMSFGSRATQAKPEALPSCSESSYDRSGGIAGVSAREDFLTEIFITRVRSRARRRYRFGAGQVTRPDAPQYPQGPTRASLIAS